MGKSDVIENGNNVIEYVIVNDTHVTNDVTNNCPDVTNNVTNDVTNNSHDVTNNDDLRKEAVIEMMRKNKRVSVTQIAKELNVTRRTIFRIIDTLKSQNRIKRVGDLKSGTWEVLS